MSSSPQESADTPPAAVTAAEQVAAVEHRSAASAVDAVTVIVVRDRVAADDTGDEGTARLEVLLLERHGASAFAPGALVFPGGKLDDADGRLPAACAVVPRPDAWQRRLGVQDRSAARRMLVAAVRETFEESGILLARHRDGASLAQRPLPREELELVRTRMAARGGDYDWGGWLVAKDLELRVDALAMWSWWVTPAGLPRRFDTRFLITALPAGQEASYDAVETTASQWISPVAALDAHRAGALHVIYPTRCTLEQLARYPDAAAAIAAARSGEVDLRRIEPRVVSVDGVAMVQHPDGGPAAPV